MLPYFLPFGLLISLFVSLSSSNDSKIAQYVNFLDDDVIKSPNDPNNYRYVQLTNQMKVLLVSEKYAHFSTISLNVRVGYMNCPKHNPYLAEMLQQVLTSLVVEYSDDDDGSDYSIIGWRSHTKADHMIFSCDLLRSKWAQGLRRLANVFTAPKFSINLVRDAQNYVNKDVKSDFYENHHWRWLAGLRSMSNKSHDFYAPLMSETPESVEKYTKKIRAAEMLKELVTFYEQHFSANLMTIAIIGNETIEQLMSQVVPLFAAIANKHTKSPIWPIHPYGPQQTGYYFHIETKFNLEEFVVLFPIPDYSAYFKSKPWSYVTHLFTRRGENSFLANQKTRKLIEIKYLFEAEVEKMANGFWFLKITCHLTDTGRENVQAVVKLFVDYLNFLQNKNVQEWLHNEIQAEFQVNFKLFKPREENRMNYAEDLASTLSIPSIPPKYCVSEKYVMEKYSPELIRQFMSHLTMENMNVFVWTETLKDKSGRKTKWFDKPCFVKRISEILGNSYVQTKNPYYHSQSANFLLPKPNLYLPSNLDIIKSGGDDNFTLPTIIYESSIGRIWYLKDNLFLLPKVHVYFKFLNPIMSRSMSNRAAAYLYENIIKNSLLEYFNVLMDEKSVAIVIHFYKIHSGFVLKFSGYNHKMLDFIQAAFRRLLNLHINRAVFALAKARIVKNLRNTDKMPVRRLIDTFSDVLLTTKEVTPMEMLRHIEDTTFESLMEFRQDFFFKFFAELFVYGNIDNQGAIKIMHSAQEVIREYFPTTTGSVDLNEIDKPRTILLPEGKQYLFVTKSNEPLEATAAAGLVFQTGPTHSIRNNALNAFVSDLFHNSLYKYNLNISILRNKRYAGVNTVEIVGSDFDTPEVAVSQIEGAIKKIEESVVKMKAKRFEMDKNYFFRQKTRKIRYMSYAASNYWKEIVDEEYFFNRSHVLAEIVRNFTKDDVINFIKEKLHPDSPKRRMLSIFVYSTNQTMDSNGNAIWNKKNVTLISDIKAFQKSRPLYGLPEPMMNIKTI